MEKKFLHLRRYELNLVQGVDPKDIWKIFWETLGYLNLHEAIWKRFTRKCLILKNFTLHGYQQRFKSVYKKRNHVLGINLVTFKKASRYAITLVANLIPSWPAMSVTIESDDSQFCDEKIAEIVNQFRSITDENVRADFMQPTSPLVYISANCNKKEKKAVRKKFSHTANVTEINCEPKFPNEVDLLLKSVVRMEEFQNLNLQTTWDYVKK